VVVVGRLEHGGLGTGIPRSILEAEMVLQMGLAVLANGRADVKDEVVTAAAAHAGEQSPAPALGVMCRVIALRRLDNEIVIRASIGTRREDAQRGALSQQFVLSTLREVASKPVLDKSRGQSPA
jgi:hypothetical protein